MAQEEEIKKVLDRLEERLKERIPRAARRSPETLIDELQAYELVLDLKRKLEH